MKTSIVIPMFNHWELTHALLYDLYNWCTQIDEVLLVDNGSTEKDGRDWWLGSGMLPLRVIRIEENIGFLKAANVGMKEAAGDIVILISNDVKIRMDIVHEIKERLFEAPRQIVGGRLIGWNTGWNTFDGVIYPYLEGWLLACYKKDWQEIGGFDELFAPNDYEDIDFSTSAVHKGFTLAGLDLSEVTHIGAQSIKYGPEREKITEANKEKFKQKWILNQKSA